MNKVLLMGRLTRDPELRYTTTNNTAVCNFTLAVNRRFQRQGEEKQADFIPIVVWGKLAQFCERYFKKGRQVVVIGRLQLSSWDDNEGKKRYKAEVIAEEAYFADSRPGGTFMDDNAGNSEIPGAYDEGDGMKEDGNGFYTLDDDDELPF
jgi:single-strand DNA-binding protein